MLSENNPRPQPNTPERRLMRRFDMRLPAVVRLERQSLDRQSLNQQSQGQQSQDQQGEDEQNKDRQSEGQPNEIETETQNVSARGVYFYLDRSVPAGTRCEITLTFPPHITLTDAVRVRFSARIIRSELPLPSARVGTAAMIEDYEFLRSTGTPDFLSVLRAGWKTN